MAIGMYGETDAERDILKMAPEHSGSVGEPIALESAAGVFPIREIQKQILVFDIMDRLMKHSRGVNDTKMKDTMFLTWFFKCVHTSMSHIRAVALYPNMCRIA